MSRIVNSNGISNENDPYAPKMRGVCVGVGNPHTFYNNFFIISGEKVEIESYSGDYRDIEGIISERIYE